MTPRPLPEQFPPEPVVRLAQELLADTRRLLEHPALGGTAPLNPEVQREVTRELREACVRLRVALDALDAPLGTNLRKAATNEAVAQGVRFFLSFREDRRRG